MPAANSGRQFSECHLHTGERGILESKAKSEGMSMSKKRRGSDANDDGATARCRHPDAKSVGMQSYDSDFHWSDSAESNGTHG